MGDFLKPNGIKCGTFGASSIEERHLATGDHAGKLAIYDLDRIDTPVFSQQVNITIFISSIITTIYCLFIYLFVYLFVCMCDIVGSHFNH